MRNEMHKCMGSIHAIPCPVHLKITDRLTPEQITVSAIAGAGQTSPGLSRSSESARPAVGP
jgi:hypothetical protein